VIDWTNQQQSYIDPVTGVEFWRVTGPGMMNIATLSLAAQNAGILGVPLDASGTGKWASIANIGSNGAAFSLASGGPADKAFIPWRISRVSRNHVRRLVSEVYGGRFVVRCLLRKCCGERNDHQFAAIDGWRQTVAGNPVTSAVCPVGAPVKLGTYPQLAVNAPFLSWGFSPQHHLVVPPSGTVSVAGSAVTLQSPTERRITSIRTGRLGRRF